jgi:hypothetical protein
MNSYKFTCSSRCCCCRRFTRIAWHAWHTWHAALLLHHPSAARTAIHAPSAIAATALHAGSATRSTLTCALGTFGIVAGLGVRVIGHASRAREQDCTKGGALVEGVTSELMASIFADLLAFARVGLDGQRTGLIRFAVAGLAGSTITNLGVLVVERASWALEHQITGGRALVELGAAGLVFVGEAHSLLRTNLNGQKKS